jgi:hypothetical protein
MARLSESRVSGIPKDHCTFAAGLTTDPTDGRNTPGLDCETGLTQKVDLSVSAGGAWTMPASHRQDHTGCLDVDLTAVPATNLLPIPRLNLEVGTSEELLAA